jgi:hypothetical protein
MLKEVLYDLFLSPYMDMVIKLNTNLSAGYVVHLEKIRNAYKILV